MSAFFWSLQGCRLIGKAIGASAPRTGHDNNRCTSLFKLTIRTSVHCFRRTSIGLTSCQQRKCTDFSRRRMMAIVRLAPRICPNVLARDHNCGRKTWAFSPVRRKQCSSQPGSLADKNTARERAPAVADSGANPKVMARVELLHSHSVAGSTTNA
jgi:hypothetical protein